MRSMLALLALPAIRAADSPDHDDEICAGCPYEMDPTNLEIQKLVPDVIVKFNKDSQSEYYTCMKDINRATGQVVEGFSYDMQVSPSKKDESTHDCDTDGGSKQQCEVNVWVRKWIHPPEGFQITISNCVCLNQQHDGREFKARSNINCYADE
ncbi:hypothetical protein PT974_03219 [Cladobotryum mycophilum]|uniref:Cystatin domain-containing protein n=1 Tax=Cladobotryum mycophilum TaxID=491253 RepID=A0ABR0SRU1_9HYPO